MLVAAANCRLSTGRTAWPRRCLRRPTQRCTRCKTSHQNQSSSRCRTSGGACPLESRGRIVRACTTGTPFAHRLRTCLPHKFGMPSRRLAYLHRGRTGRSGNPCKLLVLRPRMFRRCTPCTGWMDPSPRRSPLRRICRRWSCQTQSSIQQRRPRTLLLHCSGHPQRTTRPPGQQPQCRRMHQRSQVVRLVETSAAEIRDGFSVDEQVERSVAAQPSACGATYALCVHAPALVRAELPDAALLQSVSSTGVHDPGAATAVDGDHEYTFACGSTSCRLAVSLAGRQDPPPNKQTRLWQCTARDLRNGR